jgi:MSHA biogenesis protein MshK
MTMKPMSNYYLAAILLSAAARTASADRLADPTRPASAKADTTAEPTDSIRLEAILRSGERHLAIVNGKVVRAGERIGGALIDEVLADGVRYTRDGQSHTARLNHTAISVRQNVVQQESGT